jgi:hypothetical protein
MVVLESVGSVMLPVLWQGLLMLHFVFWPKWGRHVQHSTFTQSTCGGAAQCMC